ncbi:N-acetylmuramoyl-L-alanine amidase [uncultured Metabacillus sp.]|uniref:N-acetylmuramoyl-L-alanine amidase n=1 Tax=uncultured Metabacillus sp. TaxID=2860135 RepID=UPI002625FC1A|nr:N-acetylmuramoyl-L-alanine amidase [uncultured Metabacillus sp.]
MTTIVLDPGHGGTDSGAVNQSFFEKTFNLDIALMIRNYLRKHYDVNVIMTRSTDTELSLFTRTNLANQVNADYFCSIHINAGGGTGWESYIYNGSVSEQTVRAQETIHNYVMSQIRPYGVRDRGMKRANFHVLRETNMPSILLENLFIDTNFDLNLLRNKTFLEKLGNAIGEGLARALALSRINVDLYVVIAGSFVSLDNAQQRRNFLRSNGIEAIVVTTEIDGVTKYRVQSGAFRNRDLAEVRLDVVQNLGIEDAFIITK